MVLSRSKKISYLLTKMGIFSYLDVIAHYPRKYDDFSLSDPKSLFHLKDKEKVFIEKYIKILQFHDPRILGKG